MVKLKKISQYAAFFVFFALFLLQPTKYMKSFLDGVTIWAINVLPAIFPFALLTALLPRLDAPRKFSVTRFLFGLNCDGLFFTSILCGYPLGAKQISQSNADASAAQRLNAFCSTPGPVFVVASVGNMLRNHSATIILGVSLLLGSIMNGIVWRKKSTCFLTANNTSKNFSEKVCDSILSVLCVGGLIALSFMLIEIAKCLLPPSVQNTPLINFLFGLIEMTTGCALICNSCSVQIATILSSVLLGFGGICVALQSLTFLSKVNVTPWAYFKTKITQAFFCGFFAFVLTSIAL